MNVYKAFFSPTGGTKKVIDYLLSDSKENIIDIDLYKKDNEFKEMTFNKDDVLYLFVPSFGGRAPLDAMTNVNKLKGNETRAIIGVSYGNRAYEDTLLELYKSLKERGFIVIGAISAVVEHSIIRTIAKDRPNSFDITQLHTFHERIINKINSLNSYKEISMDLDKEMKPYKKSSLHIETSPSCVNCKICANACIKEAIDFDNPRLVDINKCIGCMRCISICPIKAKTLNEDEYKYLNDKLNVSAKDPKYYELFI